MSACETCGLGVIVGKKELRVNMIAQRTALEDTRASALGLIAQKAMLGSSCWKDASRVALYTPIRKELATDLLCAAAIEQGKTLFLPRCSVKDRGLLELVPCPDLSELRPGSFGIPEPPEEQVACDLDDARQAPDLLIIPALAVDNCGYRLGYGGGFYDRLLQRPSFAGSIFVALVYALQLLDKAPVDDWDVRLHGVCSEEGLKWF